MAAPLRHIHPPLPFPSSIHALPRIGAEQQPGLHMVKKEPGDETELFGPAGIHRAVLAVGVDGI